MAFQLVYTSYPVSLSVGRSGFSTVARSSDMPEKLVVKVEKCGIYDSRAPIIYSHRIVEANGGKWHVLSRVCDSGTDYTNRNNYIAHHLVISSEEAMKLGVVSADILLNWGGWRDSWNEEPKYLPEVDLSGLARTSRLPASKWAAIFGDAGCAAILENSPAWIRAEPSDSKRLLELFGESLCVFFNIGDSWQATYTTFFCPGDSPQDFMWRAIPFVPDQGVCADLVSGKCVFPHGRPADYARTGILTNTERLNLKVSKPLKIERKYRVVETQNKKTSNIVTAALIVSILFLLTAIGVLAAILFSGSSSPSAGEPLESLEPSNISQNTSYGANSISGLKSKIASLIESGDVMTALSLWDSSPLAANDPHYRMSLLSSAGRTVDKLLLSAEELLGNSDLAGARRDLYIAERILQCEEIPRRADRLKNLNTLKDKIK